MYTSLPCSVLYASHHVLAYTTARNDTSLQLLVPHLLQYGFRNVSCTTTKIGGCTIVRRAPLHSKQVCPQGLAYFGISGYIILTHYTNLLVQMVFFLSVFVLKICIHPGLAQLVREFARRPVMHYKARGEALRFYNAQYREDNSSESPSVWLASVPVVPQVDTSLHQ